MSHAALHQHAEGQRPAGPTARAAQGRRLGAVIGITLVVMAIEVAGGLRSGSLALLSDAGHMLTDLLALVLSLMAVRFAARPASPAKTYGYHRVEILTALVNGALLVVVAVGLALESARRVFAPAPVATGTMAIVAVAGLFGNLLGLWLLAGHCSGLNVRSARLHLVGDALSSAAVVAAALVILATGWWRLDPLAAFVISLGIAWGAVRLVREAVDVLLEGTPRGVAIEEVRRVLLGIPGVAEVHDVHIWSITTGFLAFSGHVRAGEDPAPGPGAAGGDPLLGRIRQTLRDRFGIAHTTIQIETDACRDLCEPAALLDASR
jgi:cobalt-zinc-cadmium efflux system protein